MKISLITRAIAAISDNIEEVLELRRAAVGTKNNIFILLNKHLKYKLPIWRTLIHGTWNLIFNFEMF